VTTGPSVGTVPRKIERFPLSSVIRGTEATRAMVTLDLPGVRHVGSARPGDYGYLLKAGFVVHEVRGADGAVTGYLMAPGRAHVMVWEREPRGGVVVTVTGLPESGGGGGGGGGGAM
jgi:hypothetical protein